MSIKMSLYFRAKSFVDKVDIEKLSTFNQFSDTEGLSLELLKNFETIKAYHKKADVLIDIGAHKGLFSKAANLFFNLKQTVCVEPNDQLADLIKSNNAKKNILIYNCALSQEVSEEVIFYLHKDNTMSSIVPSENKILKEEFPWDNPDQMQQIKVKTCTLDNLLETNNLLNNNFILKLDTQGNELNILKHGIKTLQNTEICIIEYIFLSPYKTNYTFGELIYFMEQQKFQCKGALDISKRPSKKISAVDFIFIKNETF